MSLVVDKDRSSKYDVYQLSTEEEWKALKAKSSTQLLVIDLHREWSGPCKVMEPLFEKLASREEKFNSRCMILLVNETASIQFFQEIFKNSNHSCVPLFYLVKHGNVVIKVNGANGPELEEGIMETLPPVQTA